MKKLPLRNHVPNVPGAPGDTAFPGARAAALGSV